MLFAYIMVLFICLSLSQIFLFYLTNIFQGKISSSEKEESESGEDSSDDDILWYDYEDSMKEHKVDIWRDESILLDIGFS